ncbi:AraC family transcriptional regulator ligand-binding domain-containing protein [Breoghania sp.]|uniref:AraC family transcriptional regulator ligand-binding domain-containing protein n=1 Tax=Breoghania sp. TaxID=2065378 RepID=UPI00260468E0|nr:AraC family transcriptional regulator ligand-binding domain-containing protein [Breoghania sp.]MDJ0931610.1 AraC family transcriptional regulator ligand-binding domain-containing protein [Breoghania sp.]
MAYVTSLFARKMIAASGDAVDGAALLRAAGLDPEGDPKVMIPETSYYDLLESIAERIDVTDLPVRGGASMRCDDYGALGLAWKAAPNLRGSFSRVERYARLWTSVVSYELRPDPHGALFILHRSGPRRFGLRLSNETTLAKRCLVGPAGQFRSLLAVGSADPASRTEENRCARSMVRVSCALRCGA